MHAAGVLGRELEAMAAPKSPSRCSPPSAVRPAILPMFPPASLPLRSRIPSSASGNPSVDALVLLLAAARPGQEN